MQNNIEKNITFCIVKTFKISILVISTLPAFTSSSPEGN